MAKASGNDTLLAIGDAHFPWACTSTVLAIITAAAKLQPKYIVQMGDIMDMYSFSRYGKSLNLTTPADELANAMEQARLMWVALRKASPASKCYQLLGNHDSRLSKKVAEKMPELAGILDDSALFAFKGVETMKSEREILELTVQGHPWALHHGYLSRAGDHVKAFQKSCITGHSHKAHVLPYRLHDKLLWDVNCGYVGDPTAPVFTYGNTIKNHWTRAYAVIDSLGPRIVSLEA